MVTDVNPSDVKSRSGLTSPTMEFPRVIPHSDGAGVVEAVGEGVSKQWIGQRVWTINVRYR
ncbi:alcohol dehydrogenase catalytic domain-containing protein [Paraburkholderia sediminicola]|uniref:alcohol dehydrogenase catalytic domain-containing protein n=1 Tax=Paraburkholderia sediminicola TaxID=458836 RepID=UPI0038BCF955